jgi:hypothetical protein
MKSSTLSQARIFEPAKGLTFSNASPDYRERVRNKAANCKTVLPDIQRLHRHLADLAECTSRMRSQGTLTPTIEFRASIITVEIEQWGEKTEHDRQEGARSMFLKQIDELTALLREERKWLAI